MGDELQTSDFKYKQESVIGSSMPSISPISSGASHLGLYPLSGNAVTLNLVRTTDITTNWEALRIGSDIQVANEFAFQITKVRSGSLRPFNFYMFDTKLFSMDTANTVTFYKNLIMSGADININGNKIINTGTITLPEDTDTLVGRATTDTLSNKTLQKPTLDDLDATPVADRRLTVIDGFIRATDTSDVQGRYIQKESLQQITNAELTSGVYSAITGLGEQSQNLDMGGNTLVGIQNIQFENASQNIISSASGVRQD